jgi:hypothetical protein
MNTGHDRDSIAMAWLALATGILPLFVVNAAYLISIAGDHIPKCIPYIQGCTSISAAGRYGLAYFFFKAGMIPAAVLLAAFWIMCRRWLLILGATDGHTLRAIVFTGCTSAAFLILYSVFLGSTGEFYSLMRRYGINIFFSFGYLAQLLLLGRLKTLQQSGLIHLPRIVLDGKLTLMIVMLVLGLGSIPLSDVFTDAHRPRNIVEWNFSVLMISYYFLTWRAWKYTGFRITPEIGLRTDE